MCRYIPDNARIARYVGCSTEEVSKTRTQLARTASERVAAPRLAVESARSSRGDGWQREARDASEQLRQAIARAQNLRG